MVSFEYEPSVVCSLFGSLIAKFIKLDDNFFYVNRMWLVWNHIGNHAIIVFFIFVLSIFIIYIH